MEKLKKASILYSVISQSNAEIKKYEGLKSHKEIIVVPNCGKIQELIDDSIIHYDGKENIAPMYFTGKKKDAILDALIKKEEEFRDGRMLEAEKL